MQWYVLLRRKGARPGRVWAEAVRCSASLPAQSSGREADDRPASGKNEGTACSKRRRTKPRSTGLGCASYGLARRAWLPLSCLQNSPYSLRKEDDARQLLVLLLLLLLLPSPLAELCGSKCTCLQSPSFGEHDGRMQRSREVQSAPVRLVLLTCRRRRWQGSTGFCF